MFRRQLQRIDYPQYLVKVAARCHWINENQLNLLVRADDVNVAHGRIIGGRTLLRVALDLGGEHPVQLCDFEIGITDDWVIGCVPLGLFNVFVVGPDKKVKLIIVYPMTTGRNFDEVLRVIDSLQLTAKHKVATPVNWKQGDDVIIAGSVSDDDAKKTYPQGWKAPRPYIRIVPQPK